MWEDAHLNLSKNHWSAFRGFNVFSMLCLVELTLESQNANNTLYWGKGWICMKMRDWRATNGPTLKMKIFKFIIWSRQVHKVEIMRPCHRLFLPALSFSLRLDCFLSVDVDVGQLLILFDLELPGQIREYRGSRPRVWWLRSQRGLPGVPRGWCEK